MSDKVDTKAPAPAEVPVQKPKPVTFADLAVAAQSQESKEYARIPGFTSSQVVVIRNVSAGDIIEWSEANEGDAKRTAGLRLIIKSVVDGQPGVDDGAKGEPIMDDSALQVLRKLPHKTTENIVKAIIKLNGMEVKQDRATKND